MGSIVTIKEQEALETPLLLFACALPNGETKRWCTHRVTHEGEVYEPRVLSHNALEMRTLSDDGIDATARIAVTLANADSYCSQIERSVGWKGSKLTIQFVFFDLRAGAAASEAVVVFRGSANAPDEITEALCRLSFTNRLGLQRVLLPTVRIQRLCPWMFPSSGEQRLEAMTGGEEGRYSPFFACGYSADQEGGEGNLDGGAPFLTCGRTRDDCEARGMFRQDSRGNPTRRFGGIEFLPPSITVRSHGERGWHTAAPTENEARYNDFVPLVYGTAWFDPPVVFARNDGNLTRSEVLLGMGEIEGVRKVTVNGIEIPEGVAGKDMTATGWYNLVSRGNRTGDFNLDFTDGSGTPAGDPYGSMAFLSVVVPNRVSDGRTLARIQVLLDGLRLERFSLQGEPLGAVFTNNPVWVLLDLLRRCGWALPEIDLGSFAGTAEYCDELITVEDLHGNPVQLPRYQCNLAVRRRRSAADLVRGVRTGSGLFLTYGAGGKLQVSAERTLEGQGAVKREGSNSTTTLDGGWPAYEFGDGSLGFSGILRRENGEPALRLWSRPTADVPNRLSIEFQDEFNEYQQDSLSLVDFDDALKTGQEISARLPALGVTNFSQAVRVLRRHLEKGIRGNVFLEFETSVRAIGLRPGDLIAVTYLREGWQRQPFRVMKIAAGLNHATSVLTCQVHDDGWYTDDSGQAAGGAGRLPGGEVGLPRPLMGARLDANGRPEFDVTERTAATSDGGAAVALAVSFTAPRAPSGGAMGLPLLSLTAQVSSAGGSLPGGEQFYYAISAVDATNEETDLSFVVRAVIPAGTATNTVSLTGISLPRGATGFRVYRGPDPSRLFQIADGQPPSGTFTDTGLSAMPFGPPDANYDHARFYWRLEKAPEHQATEYAADRIGSDVLQMIENEHAGMVVRITRGTGEGQERTVLSNDDHTLSVTPNWGVTPDGTSYFVIAESGWHFGASGKTSPVEFEAPNRGGATVQISGRSVNAHGRECPYELSPLTRWTIGGATGGNADPDVPGRPVFGLLAGGQGTVIAGAVGFESLDNTATIQAGTLTVHFWNELDGASGFTLAAALDAGGTIVELSTPGPASVGTLLQVDAEILVVEELLDGGARYEVSRGSHGTVAAAHPAGSVVYHLDRRVFVIPFVKNFFGSPASGSFRYPIHLPNVRIGAAELYVTNSRGNSETARLGLTGTIDQGLRTLSGGQWSIQVSGPLAIESDAAPPLIVEGRRAVRDVFAVMKEPPTGAPVQLGLFHNGEPYCELTIPAGETVSATVPGFGLPVLAEGARLSVNVVSVGQTADSSPGRDLTVVLRL